MGAGVGVKEGISVVIDFKNKGFGFYPHLGYFYCVKWNAFGISYSTGVVRNYVNEGDYAGPFIDMGAGYYGGLDVCYDPRNNIDNTVKAYSLTFGNNIGGCYGYDYYWYAGSVAFISKKRKSVGGFIYEV